MTREEPRNLISEAIVQYLKDWDRPYAPSLDEIGAHVGTCKSETKRYLDQLRRRGVVSWLPNQPRTIHLIQK